MKKNETIEYDKISDDIYWISTDTVLKMNVTLARKNQDGTRRYFHSEYEYDSKYTDKRRVTSIRRSFDYYLTLENLNDKDCFTMIQQSDIFALRETLMKVSRWISSNRIFGTINGSLIVQSKPEPEVVRNLRGSKHLSFEPTIVRYSDIVSPGIRMVFFNGAYTDISVDKFMGFKYCIDSIDMYGSAVSLVNYIGRPPIGTGLYSIPPNNAKETEIVKDPVIPKRTFNVKEKKYGDLDDM